MRRPGLPRAELKSRLHETAYLNPELTIEYEDRRDGKNETEVFQEPEGIVGFVKDLNKKKEALHEAGIF